MHQGAAFPGCQEAIAQQGTKDAEISLLVSDVHTSSVELTLAHCVPLCYKAKLTFFGSFMSSKGP